MAPLEVAAAGRPTIAYRAGGAIETIVDGVTGVFFDRQEASDLARAIQRFERQEWSAAVLRRHAEGFGIDIFQSRFRQFLALVGAPSQRTLCCPSLHLLPSVPLNPASPGWRIACLLE
jgi:glycosyltransferase involved in cell wall biosynthesis